MRKLGIVPIVVVMSVVMVFPVWARDISVGKSKIEVDDSLTTAYDSLIQKGVVAWREQNEKSNVFTSEVHDVYAYADGAVEVVGEHFGDKFDIVVLPSGQLSKDRYFVKAVGDVEYFEEFLLQGLRQWAIAYSPMGGVDLLSYDAEGSLCVVKVGNEQKTLKVTVEGEQAPDTVRVLQWFKVNTTSTEKWQLEGLRYLARETVRDSRFNGVISVSFITHDNGERETLGESSTHIMEYVQTDEYTASSVSSKKTPTLYGFDSETEKYIGR